MNRSRSRATPELATFAVSAAILLGLVGAIVFLWVQESDPALLTVEQVGEMRVVEDQSYLSAEVRNAGDETAHDVQVLAELISDGEVIAAGEQFVDFLSGGEVEEIVFILDRAAPEAEIALRVASYKVP